METIRVGADSPEYETYLRAALKNRGASAPKTATVEDLILALQVASLRSDPNIESVHVTAYGVIEVIPCTGHVVW